MVKREMQGKGVFTELGNPERMQLVKREMQGKGVFTEQGNPEGVEPE